MPNQNNIDKVIKEFEDIHYDKYNSQTDAVGQWSLEEQKSWLTKALTQAFETGRDMGRGEAIEIVTNADAPYTTECCRKTANFYKDQIKEGLTNLTKPSE